jgi:hypothetical protein
VEPAGDLVPRAAQVPVALGPQLEHRRVILGCHLPRSRRAQRRDRDRAGVVRVVLARPPGRQQPHPGAQLGLHIEHELAPRPPAAGRAGSPGRRHPRLPRSAPARTLPTPPAARPGPPKRVPAARPAVPRPRRSPPRYATPYADQRRSLLLPSARSFVIICREGPWRACLIPDWRRASYEPRHGEIRQAGTSLLSQTASGRQAFREPAHRTSERYDQAATPTRFSNQAARRAFSLTTSATQRDAVDRHTLGQPRTGSVRPDFGQIGAQVGLLNRFPAHQAGQPRSALPAGRQDHLDGRVGHYRQVRIDSSGRVTARARFESR